MKRLISAHAAAKELGVSPSTFKRFCESRKIPMQRTPGGHRRFDRSHLPLAAQLLKAGEGDEPLATATPDQVFELLKNGNLRGLVEMFWISNMPSLRMIELLENSLVPALWKVGELWQRGEMSFAAIKVCVSTSVQLLDALAAQMAEPQTGRTYVGATLGDNQDTVALRLVDLGFKAIGARAIDLGCGVTTEVMLDAVTSFNACGVFLSYTHIPDAWTMLREFDQLIDALPPSVTVIVGGGALSPAIRRSMRRCRYFESVQAMAITLEAEWRSANNVPLASSFAQSHLPLHQHTTSSHG